ncbi:unnamed protein product [Symbiodinium sp. CCMP2592]|nr:unnamed protein product [Symbiodinium sp. CCMP2592]
MAPPSSAQAPSSIPRARSPTPTACQPYCAVPLWDTLLMVVVHLERTVHFRCAVAVRLVTCTDMCRKADVAQSSSRYTCDKCDGPHPTERCPHFEKDREEHKDAWVNYGCKNDPHQMGGNPGNFVLRNAAVVRQSGDGSCLYHSLSYGLGNTDATSLRVELALFLKHMPGLEIAGDSLEEWVRWDSNLSVDEYARRQSTAGWGGGIEMACCSHMKNINVHVYTSVSRSSSDFKRISCFNAPKQDRRVRTIHVLYQGGLHYDALQT